MRLGCLSSTWLQEEPLSLYKERGAIRSSPDFLCDPRASGVEYVRLPSVGVSGDTFGELLSGKSEWRPVPHSIGVG